MRDECTHPGLPLVAFDEEAARAIIANCKHKQNANPALAFIMGCLECTAEIRRRWPRGFHGCVRCGSQVISYASSAHYTYGDW